MSREHMLDSFETDSPGPAEASPPAASPELPSPELLRVAPAAERASQRTLTLVPGSKTEPIIQALEATKPPIEIQLQRYIEQARREAANSSNKVLPSLEEIVAEAIEELEESGELEKLEAQKKIREPESPINLALEREIRALDLDKVRLRAGVWVTPQNDDSERIYNEVVSSGRYRSFEVSDVGLTKDRRKVLFLTHPNYPSERIRLEFGLASVSGAAGDILESEEWAALDKDLRRHYIHNYANLILAQTVRTSYHEFSTHEDIPFGQGGRDSRLGLMRKALEEVENAENEEEKKRAEPILELFNEYRKLLAKSLTIHERRSDIRKGAEPEEPEPTKIRIRIPGTTRVDEREVTVPADLTNEQLTEIRNLRNDMETELQARLNLDTAYKTFKEKDDIGAVEGVWKSIRPETLEFLFKEKAFTQALDELEKTAAQVYQYTFEGDAIAEFDKAIKRVAPDVDGNPNPNLWAAKLARKFWEMSGAMWDGNKAVSDFSGITTMDRGDPHGSEKEREEYRKYQDELAQERDYKGLIEEYRNSATEEDLKKIKDFIYFRAKNTGRVKWIIDPGGQGPLVINRLANFPEWAIMNLSRHQSQPELLEGVDINYQNSLEFLVKQVADKLYGTQNPLWETNLQAKKEIDDAIDNKKNKKGSSGRFKYTEITKLLEDAEDRKRTGERSVFHRMDPSVPFALWAFQNLTKPEAARTAMVESGESFLRNPNEESLYKLRDVFDHMSKDKNEEQREKLTENFLLWALHDRYNRTGKSNYTKEQVWSAYVTLMGINDPNKAPFIQFEKREEFYDLLVKEVGKPKGRVGRLILWFLVGAYLGLLKEISEKSAKAA